MFAEFPILFLRNRYGVHRLAPVQCDADALSEISKEGWRSVVCKKLYKRIRHCGTGSDLCAIGSRRHHTVAVHNCRRVVLVFGEVGNVSSDS